MRSRAAVALAATLAVSCGTRLMRLPEGPATAVSVGEAQTRFDAATAACRDIRTLTGEVGVTGSAAGSRVRGRLLVGVEAPASARIEAPAPFGAPMFIFVAAGDEATVLFPRDRRVLERAEPAEVLEAVAGVPLDGADLRNALSGCAELTGPFTAEGRGADWCVLTMARATISRALYLQREPDAGPWRLVADIRTGPAGEMWRAEFRDFEGGLPGSIHLVSGAARARESERFDLRLSLRQVETNTPLDARAFTIEIPPDTEPITLEELRRSGPLAP